LGNTSQQKQEVVFGKSSSNQKSSPTSPQKSPTQKSANNGGASIQQGQVYLLVYSF
jgi:hypothetical protein